MRKGLQCCLWLCAMLLVACDAVEPEVGEAVASFENYQETGALDALQ